MTARHDDHHPVVSVLIPAFNAAATVTRAVESAVESAERVRPYEVLVADDGSIDDTPSVVAELARRNPAVRLLRSEVNEGVSAARNRALAEARGEWVALLDSDDYWLPERLSVLLGAADGFDVVSDDVLLERRPGASVLREGGLAVREPAVLWPEAMFQHSLGLLHPLLRRDFLVEHELTYNTGLRIGEDYYFFVEILLSGARWRQLPDAFYVYAPPPSSLTSDRRAHITGSREAAEALLAHPAVAARPTLRDLLARRVAWLRKFELLLDFEARRAETGAVRALLEVVRHRPAVAFRLVEVGARDAYHRSRRSFRARTARRR